MGSPSSATGPEREPLPSSRRLRLEELKLSEASPRTLLRNGPIPCVYSRGSLFRIAFEGTLKAAEPTHRYSEVKARQACSLQNDLPLQSWTDFLGNLFLGRLNQIYVQVAVFLYPWLDMLFSIDCPASLFVFFSSFYFRSEITSVSFTYSQFIYIAFLSSFKTM